MFSQTFDISMSLTQPMEQIYPTFERNFSVYSRSNETYSHFNFWRNRKWWHNFKMMACLSSTGLNHSISSLLKNMNLTVDTLLFTLKGCPDKTVLLTTILLGSLFRRDPVASRDSWPLWSSWNDDNIINYKANCKTTTRHARSQCMLLQ